MEKSNVENLLDCIFGQRVLLSEVVKSLFENSKAFHNLSFEHEFAADELASIITGICNYLNKEHIEMITLIPNGRPLIGHEIEVHEFVRLFGNEFLWEAEFFRAASLRMEMAVWLVAILIRLRYCRDEEEKFSVPAMIRFFGKLSLLDEIKLTEFCKKLEDVVKAYETYPI